MKTTTLFTSMIQRPVRFTYKEWTWLAMHTRTRALKAYADWRVGATAGEKRAHKTSDSILLTFDDFGSPEQVDALLQLLGREHTRAMFFLQGDWAQQYPQLVAKIAAAGHIVGNHTYSHPDLLSLSDDDIRTEISRGLPGPWLRPPQGRYNARIRELARQLGYVICYWSIDSDDWQGVSAEYIARKVLARLHPGAVILFHVHAPHTLEALPAVIAGIRQRGYALTSPDEPTWKAQS
jgi:peptidoglycan/xylan/chitin deacetylase (PgdA/CDA1 family)